MSKTAPIPDDIHTLITDKQRELKKKHKITVKISDIIALVMKNNINKVGKYLGLQSEEKSDDTSESGQHNMNGTKQDSADETEHSDTKEIRQNGMSNQESTIKNAGHSSSIIDEGAEVKT